MTQKIRPMTHEERQRAKERKEKNEENKCVSCGCPTPNTWCEFCLNEE